MHDFARIACAVQSVNSGDASQQQSFCRKCLKCLRACQVHSFLEHTHYETTLTCWITSSRGRPFVCTSDSIAGISCVIAHSGGDGAAPGDAAPPGMVAIAVVLLPSSAADGALMPAGHPLAVLLVLLVMLMLLLLPVRLLLAPIELPPGADSVRNVEFLGRTRYCFTPIICNDKTGNTESHQITLLGKNEL